MGTYTRIGLVHSGSGLGPKLTPSGTVNFCITRGEAAAKKYLGVTPASGEDWMQDACTSLAIHYLQMRLATQNIANLVWQGQTQRDRGARFKGHAIGASMWWEEGIRILDMHGRKVSVQRIEPT